jgi:hypothetical protein
MQRLRISDPKTSHREKRRMSEWNEQRTTTWMVKARHGMYDKLQSKSNHPSISVSKAEKRCTPESFRGSLGVEKRE